MGYTIQCSIPPAVQPEQRTVPDVRFTHKIKKGMHVQEIKKFINQFMKMESAGGIMLMMFAFLAIIFANSPLYEWYATMWKTPFEIRLGDFGLSKPVLLWINDGLMAVFFFLIGLELKREFMEGEFADRKNILLPLVGAVGGMALPAVLYALLNQGDSFAMRGWAIPAATDIAFALGVLALLGKRVPLSLKVFLTSLAIFDDIGAIIIIAVFYTSSLSMAALGLAAVCLVVLFLLNRFHVVAKSPYILVGLIMWVAVLKSGVHATLAGVATAFFIPASHDGKSPLKEMEHDLHTVVAFFILPLFAFANSGIRMIGMGPDLFLNNVNLGIIAGLFVGKQVGIFLMVRLFVAFKWVSLPGGINWKSLYGVSILAGIGFTMSLFVGSLAFGEPGVDKLFDERIGIVAGSLLSGLVGYLLLKVSLPRQVETE